MVGLEGNLLSCERDHDRHLNPLIALSSKFGDSLASAFANNVAEGKRVSDDAE